MTGLWWLSSNPTGAVAALRVAGFVSYPQNNKGDERVARRGAGRVGHPGGDTIVNGDQHERL